MTWRLCYVKNGVCVFVDQRPSLVEGEGWEFQPACDADWPLPLDYYHLRYFGFVADKVQTDLFGTNSPFNTWSQSSIVSHELPAFVVDGSVEKEVVKYGDDARTVIKIFEQNKIPCGWME